MEANGLELSIEDHHFIANDRCMQELKESPIQLDERTDIVSDHNVLIATIPEYSTPRVKNLLYFNMAAMNVFFYENDIFPVKCPVCHKNYEIRRKDYVLLLKKTYPSKTKIIDWMFRDKK